MDRSSHCTVVLAMFRAHAETATCAAEIVAYELGWLKGTAAALVVAATHGAVHADDVEHLAGVLDAIEAMRAEVVAA